MTIPDSAFLLAGPTASGKSSVALALAEQVGGEIISVDSMQVYRGLEIGTAKATPQEQARVRHHLLDVAGLDEPFDAARFLALAGQALSGISDRGSVPIFCGGTGLYFKALLEGLGAAPPRDPELRARLERQPLEELLRDLARLDPETHARIDRNNPRRVVRAMEIIRLTGQPASAQKAPWTPPGESPAHPRFFGLHRSGEDLGRRISARVDAMFAAGLVEETRRLLAQGLGRNPTALQAIGYRQVVEHLQGTRSLEDTIALVKQRTRQFARRQMTWFRRQLALRWIEVAPEDRPETVAERIANAGP